MQQSKNPSVNQKFLLKKKKRLRHFHDSLLIKKKKVDIFTQKGTQDTFLFYSLDWT